MKSGFHSVAVVGAGYMGGGIAHALARHGVDVRVSDVSPAATAAAVTRLHEQADRFGRDGLMTDAEVSMIRKHLGGAQLDQAVADADLVIEAVSEDVSAKRAVLAEVSAHAPASTVVATNSSSIGLSRLGDVVSQPFIVMHWFNPAPFLPLVELAGESAVVQGISTWLRTVGKAPVVVPDVAGFLGNRLQFALFREAALIVEEGLASPAEVDEVVTNSFGWRLPFYGPLAGADISGLDVYAGAFGVLEEAYGPRFAAPESLRARVSAGDLGLKTSGGYRAVPAEEKAALEAYRDRVFVALAKLRDELGPPPGLSRPMPVE